MEHRYFSYDLSRAAQGFRSTLLSFLLMSISLLVSAQISPNIRFNNIYSQDGLPNNTVLAIAQDSFGFIWIGTNDGLARYEAPGTFTLFRKGAEYPNNTLASDYIRSLFVDSHQQIWIGTVAGEYENSASTWW